MSGDTMSGDDTTPEFVEVNGIHYRQESDELWAWMVDDNPNGWVTFDSHDMENALCDAIAERDYEIVKLRAENDDLHGNLIRVMQERNARTFAIQCFHSHAVKNGDDDTAVTIAEYLTAAGHPLNPQHWLLNNRYVAADDSLDDQASGAATP